VAPDVAVHRKDRELLEEILSSVRATDRVWPAGQISGLEALVVPSWFEEYVRSKAVTEPAEEASMGVAIQQRFVGNAETVLSSLTCPVHKVPIRSKIIPVQPGRAQVNIQACCMFAVLTAVGRVLGFVDIR
jgi:hypothetical protein